VVTAMSSHGTSGDGQGGGIGDGQGGWASPLGTELPGPADVEDVGEGARDGVAARGEGAEGAPSGDGQGGEGERGAQPRPDHGTGGGEGLTRQAFEGARLVPRLWLLLRPLRRSWKRRAVARCFKTSSRRWRDNLR
jgi:hypothetical protein